VDDSENKIPIPADAAPILDLLLRAALCAPRLFADQFDALTKLERDETFDALNQGGLPLPQLMWEWATTAGQIDPLLTSEQAADTEQFFESLAQLSTNFFVQISVPVTGETEGSLMPPFRGQRVHLVNRTNWMNFGLAPADLEDVPDEAIPGGLPELGNASMVVGSTRIGETWVRLLPEFIRELRTKTPDDLLDTLVFLADERARQLRETLRLRQQTLREEDLVKLEGQLRVVASWQRHMHGALSALDKVPADKRNEAAGTILDIATGRYLPASEHPISVFISYSRDSDAHRAWVGLLADALEGSPTFNVIYDEYELHAGKDLTHFMESGLASDRIVVVVTPEYVRKAMQRQGGVGYESSVISAALLREQLASRVVPILREGDALPPFLASKVYADFRGDERFDRALNMLQRALLGRAPARRPEKK